MACKFFYNTFKIPIFEYVYILRPSFLNIENG